MSRSTVSLLGVLLVLGATAAVAEPANVIVGAGCGIGWLGCPVDDAIPLPDGNFTCPLSAIDIFSITGVSTRVDANSTHENRFFTCRTHIEFGQPNPTGLGGTEGDVIAAERDVICLLFPDACRGRGAVVINSRTVGAAGVCTVGAIGGDPTPTTNFQSEVTPSGQAHLACFLPDPPQGE